MKTETVYVVTEEVKKFKSLIEELKVMINKALLQSTDDKIFNLTLADSHLGQAFFLFMTLHTKEIEVKEDN